MGRFPKGRLLPVFLGLLCLSMAPRLTTALTKNFHIGSALSRVTSVLDQFGIERGGTIDCELHFLSTDRHYFAALYAIQKWRDFEVRAKLNEEWICSFPSDMRIELTGHTLQNSGKVTIQLHHVVKRTDLYRLVILDCPGGVDHGERTSAHGGSGTCTIKNSSTGHLPLEEVHIIVCMDVLTVLYIVLFISFLIYTVLKRKNYTHLHGIVCVAMAMMALMTSQRSLYQRTIQDSGSVGEFAEFYFIVVELLANMSVLVVMMLAAVGWQVVRAALEARERSVLSSAFIFYGFLGFLYETCEQEHMCGAYLLSFYVVKFLITLGIIVGMNATAERIRADYWEQVSAHAQGEYFSKLRQYHHFRWLFAVYLCIPVATLVLRMSVLTWNDKWLLYLFEGLLEFYVLAKFSIIFRPNHTPSIEMLPPESDSEMGDHINREIEMERRRRADLDGFGEDDDDDLFLRRADANEGEQGSRDSEGSGRSEEGGGGDEDSMRQDSSLYTRRRDVNGVYVNVPTSED